jgi:DNA-binding NarL/FixJ family response regulator
MASVISRSLSQREQQVLDLILKGRKNKEICADTGLAMGTVKTHLNNLYNKFNVHSRLELALKAVESGGQPRVIRRQIMGVEI